MIPKGIMQPRRRKINKKLLRMSTSAEIQIRANALKQPGHFKENGEMSVEIQVIVSQSKISVDAEILLEFIL